jgi:NAD(P)H-dependent FMN reductase
VVPQGRLGTVKPAGTKEAKTNLGGVPGSEPANEPPLVVAVTTSPRFGALQGAAMRSLTDTAARRGMATVIPLDTLPALPHFDAFPGWSVTCPQLRHTGVLFEQAEAAMFCIAEYAEGLPAMVGNLLEWAIADGFLCGKRVGWINVASGTRRARAAHHALERALEFAGAEIVTRADVPLTRTHLTANGLLTDPASVDAVISALHQLLPAPPKLTAGLPGGRKGPVP